MTFNDNWFQRQKAAVVYAALQLSRGPGAVVEVGSWEGKSSVFIANLVYPEVLICIDHWLGTPHDATAGLAADRDVFATFEENMLALTRGNWTVKRGDWREAVAGWDEPIRFVYLDAEHTEEQVDEQLRWCIPLMVEEGVIAGDDFRAYGGGVGRAARRYFGDAVVAPERGNGAWYAPPEAIRSARVAA